MICAKCQIDKPTSEFYPSKHSKSGFRYACKICGNTAAKAWHKANPDRHKESARRFYEKNPEYFKWRDIQRRYGLSKEQWFSLFESQDSKCACCRSTNPGNEVTGWHTDHCHVTGKVRGILCQPCNMLIGLAKENQQTLIACAKYLENSDAQN